MARRIKITAGEVTATGVLNDSKTADAIWDALPLEASASTWGDEIYYSVPMDCEAENAQATVEMGDLGYWPPGTAMCIFFGPTPASSGDEIRPASPVNVFGKVESDPKAFKAVPSGAKVTVARAEE